MTKHNKIILGAIIVLLAIALAFWPGRKLPPAPPALRPVGAANQKPAVVPAVTQPQPTAAPREPVATPKEGSGDPETKFSKLGILQRNAILQEIKKQDLAVIFQAMIDAKRVEHDSMKQLAIKSALATAMKTRTPSPEFIEQMREFIADSSNLKSDRYLVLGVLAAAASKETVDLLIEVVTTSSDQEMKQAAIGGLGDVGSLGGAGEKLSPALDRVWRESTDQHLLSNVATAMAQIGAPSSIELLLSATLDSDGRDHFRLATAQQTLTSDVYKVNAVPPLAARLANRPPTSEAATLVAPILVRIGDVTAAKVVVIWLQGLDQNAAALISNQLFQETRTPAMVAAWEAAVDPAVPFRNEENREAIRVRLEKRKAGIKHE